MRSRDATRAQPRWATMRDMDATTVRMPDAETVEEVLKLASRAPTFDAVPPARWRIGADRLELLTTRMDPVALIACGAALHHVRIGLSALGWSCRVHRKPKGDHLATVFPRWELDPFSNEVASAAAVSLRRSDARTFSDQEVPISALTWLLQAAQAEGASLVPVSKGNGVVLSLVAESDDLALLRGGEALSSVLLAATVWGLASHVRIDGDAVLIRVGWQWPNAEPLPHSAR
ncbi:hypothetical protein FKR81_06555 [Lentzea tibetensis]|uniref:Uncharacterized protein n=1 Tax=Lentzea tibetensis TaxID=2591470 RepID=A0A563EYI4_9PSEU|nr:hypothetical protein [Lentzea tibetensis]TWP52785.1 hypothetical protein FKR81_06555 [Lentzea tibetensis]